MKSLKRDIMYSPELNVITLRSKDIVLDTESGKFCIPVEWNLLDIHDILTRENQEISTDIYSKYYWEYIGEFEE